MQWEFFLGSVAIQANLIGLLSSTCSDISRDLLTTNSLTLLIQLPNHFSPPTLMQTMLDAGTLENPLVLTLSSWVQEPFHGVQDCRALLHFLLLKQSMLQGVQLVLKSIGLGT